MMLTAMRLIIVATVSASLMAVFASLFSINLWPIELFSAFLPQAVVACALIALVTFRRHFRFAIFTATISLLGAGLLAPFATNVIVPVTKMNNHTYVSIVQANILGSSAGAEKVLEWAVAEAASILVLTELPRNFASSTDFPNIIFSSAPGRQKIAIMSVYPITKTMDAGEYIIVELKLPAGDSFSIAAAHPAPPLSPSLLAERNRVIHTVLAEANDIENIAVVGDWNATPWSPALRAAAARHQLKRASGGLYSPTWAGPMPLFGLPIDHVYVGPSVHVQTIKTGPFINSDHWPVLAEIGVLID